MEILVDDSLDLVKPGLGAGHFLFFLLFIFKMLMQCN